MNVEDSYEGAVRRLRRLGHAGVDVASSRTRPQPFEGPDDRMRDLEELATLACDENERLTRERDAARDEVERLRRLVVTLQETIAGAQPEDDSFEVPRRGRGAAFYFFTIVILGGGAAALLMLRPWEHLPRASAVVAAPAPVVQPSAPVVAAPAPIVPKVEPTIPTVPAVPKVEPTVPKVAPTIPKVDPAARVAAPAPAPARTRAHRQHGSKHHSAKSSKHDESSRGAAQSSSQRESNDPLGGLNL